MARKQYVPLAEYVVADCIVSKISRFKEDKYYCVYFRHCILGVYTK